MESETQFVRLRSRFPNGWRFLGWPEGRLSSSNIANIQTESMFCWPVRRNVPAELESFLDGIKKVAPEAVLLAAEKAFQKGRDTVAEFLLDNPEGELEPLIFAHFHLGAHAEFARQFGAELHRDGLIRFTQRMSGNSLRVSEAGRIWL